MLPSPVSATSSASPAPATKSLSFFPRPYRAANEGHSSLKPQRSSSTPRPARVSATPEDIKLRREESLSRLDRTWSLLSEKYTRPLDEDDIIDIVTGEIVQDRGALSSQPVWTFGRFADLDDSADEGTEEDEEDDIDELNLLPSSDVPVLPSRVVRRMDPAYDPEDAQDLKDFLEEERRRREECGEDESQEEVEEGEDEERRSENDTGEDTDAASTVLVSHQAELEESESDDELLGNWGVVDDSSIVYHSHTSDSEVREISESPSITTADPFVVTHKPHVETRALKREIKLSPRQQLATPPQSRTSSTEEVSFDLPQSFSPPLSVSPSLPPSPTKAASGATPKSADRAQPRPSSKSQTPSSRSQKETRESVPMLDLAEIQRGRSRQASARRVVKKRDEPQASTSSAKVDSSQRTKKSLPAKGSDRSPPTKRRDSTSRLSTPAESRPSSELSERQPSAKPDRKGKSRAIGVEPEVRLNLAQLSPRKRKRKSLSSEEGDFIHDYRTELDSSPSKKGKRSSSASSKPKIPKPPSISDHASDSETGSEPEVGPEVHRPSYRHARAMSSIPPYYHPPAMYPYPSYSLNGDPAMAYQDPRTQFIFSQVVQHALHLSTLLTEPWSANPSTPRRSSRPVPSPYAYPSTPQHPHTHPYVFDSGASSGTLPPSSPPAGSSPPSPGSSPLHTSGVPRRSSLVSRSRSRGRRVSFRVEGEIRGAEEDAEEDLVDSPVPRPSSRRSRPVSRTDAEPDDVGAHPRVAPARRAQTPGPASVRTPTRRARASS